MASTFWSRKRHEQHLFAEAADLVATVLLCCAEDAEVLAERDRESAQWRAQLPACGRRRR